MATHPQLLSRLGLRRSPSVQTLSRLLGMVSVGMVSVDEVRRVLLGFVLTKQGHRVEVVTTAALDGKTLRGVWEDGEQLKALYVFSRDGLAALDQVAIGNHLDEPRAAQEWIETVAARCPGLEMLTGDALYADANLAQAIVDQGIVDQGRDYTFKLKKTAPNSTSTCPCSSPPSQNPTGR